MDRKNLLFISIILLNLLISCKVEDQFNFPTIQTGEVTDISVAGATFHAKISEIGTAEILDYGFAWSTEKLPDINSSMVALGKVNETGVVTSIITNDLRPNLTYYVRAFAKNEKYTTYGFPVMFKSMGSLPPSITNFNPQKGSSGTQVTIFGDNFSSCNKNNTVSIGYQVVKIDSASKNKLVVTIPGDCRISGNVDITIEVSGQKVISTDKFRLVGATINSFYPKELFGGNYLYIEGEDFDPILGNNKVKIGNTEVQVIKLSGNLLTAIVNYNLPAGNTILSVSVNGKTNQAVDLLKIKDTWSGIINNEKLYRTMSVGFSINGKGYVGTGAADESQFPEYKDLWEYNPETNLWKKCADLPAHERQSAIGFSINGKGYIGLGHSMGNFFYNDIYEFDPSTNSWTRKADFPGIARRYSCSLVINNMVYVGLGGDTPIAMMDFWKYDPVNDKWTRLSDFPKITGGIAQGFQFGDNGYFAISRPETYYYLKELWKYEPQLDKWTYLSDIPGDNRYLATCFASTDFGYIGMGYNGSKGSLNDFWRYDFINNSWNRIPDIPFGTRYSAVSFKINGINYITSGMEYYGHDLQKESLIIYKPDK